MQRNLVFRLLTMELASSSNIYSVSLSTRQRFFFYFISSVPCYFWNAHKKQSLWLKPRISYSCWFSVCSSPAIPPFRFAFVSCVYVGLHSCGIAFLVVVPWDYDTRWVASSLTKQSRETQRTPSDENGQKWNQNLQPASN